MLQNRSSFIPNLEIVYTQFVICDSMISGEIHCCNKLYVVRVKTSGAEASEIAGKTKGQIAVEVQSITQSVPDCCQIQKFLKCNLRQSFAELRRMNDCRIERDSPRGVVQ